MLREVHDSANLLNNFGGNQIKDKRTNKRRLISFSEDLKAQLDPTTA